MKLYPYLQNNQFLKELDNMSVREQYIKITVLEFFTENPIEEIQGKVTSGSMTIDGKSAVRRTCNLSLVSEKSKNDLTDLNNLFAINKKCSIEIGLKNFTQYYREYDIIWFPLGVYTFKNPNLSHSSSGLTISLTLTDKMAFLNGEAGGTIAASVSLDEEETYDEFGQVIVNRPIIYKIIQELVNHFGGEQLGRILINDIPTEVKQVMKWIGKTPLYGIYEEGNNGKVPNLLTTNANKVASLTGNSDYKIYEYGDDVGYISTTFTYPGELVASQGNTVCTILDTIKNTLGNYEYYYDVYGNFIFQEIKNYLNTSKATVDLNNIQNDINYDISIAQGKAVYVFDNSNLISSYSNSPSYDMIKNDFVIWGIRTTADGMQLPIRYHLAIDKKPIPQGVFENLVKVTNEDGLIVIKSPIFVENISVIPRGVVGVYYLCGGKIFTWNTDKKDYIVAENAVIVNIKPSDWRAQLYLQGVVAEYQGLHSNDYYVELVNEFPKIYDWVEESGYWTNKIKKEVLEHPEMLDYFLDFIDTPQTQQFSVQAIGRRTFSENSNDINCLFEPIPNDIILIEAGQENTNEIRQEWMNQGIPCYQVDSSLYSGLATGGSLYGAYSRVRELLYQYLSYNETITLQTIPIYHLEPNTRITVKDTVSGIHGDYIINSISLPLNNGGTMTINASRALERL